MIMLRCMVLGPALCRAVAITTRPSGGRSLLSTIMAAAASSTILENKVFLVTGSTDGIGRHTASRLAETGATVLVHGRREASVRDAVEFIESKGSGVSKVEGFVADVSSLRGMNLLCDEVLARTDRLDCLINNKGVCPENFRRSDDGLEYTFAVNVLAPYVITDRLLDLIARAPDGGRIVNVVSHVASRSADFDNLQFEKGSYNGHAAYALSKLLDIMFNTELAKRTARGVTCNALHPGVLVGQWERAAALVGNSALVIKIIQGGMLFYMWSECLFGLMEEAGALTAALTVAVRPVAVYAFSAAFWGGGWTTLGAAGAALTAVGAALFSAATHKYMLKQPLSKQQ